jgi:hypothetical protein
MPTPRRPACSLSLQAQGDRVFSLLGRGPDRQAAQARPALGELSLPKLGRVRFRWTRPVKGIIRNATVLKEAEDWFISLCIDDGRAEVQPNGSQRLEPIAALLWRWPQAMVSASRLPERASGNVGALDAALQWHGKKNGCEIVHVPAAYTSITCSACGSRCRESRESQADFGCITCGCEDNADVNAAKNLLAAGLAVTGRGDLGVTQSAKRQPPDPEAAFAST